ncbi:hypothetical protein ACS0TY_030033 [Phlomoides rotata]
MDYYNQYNIKSMNDPKKSNHLTKITQVLLSVSVFAFLLSQSSLLPLLISSYENLVLDFINFKFKLFTYTTERNCIFLLCNGILLLIIQSSGLISKITPVIPASKAAPIEDHHEEIREDETGKFQETGKKGVGKEEILEEKTGEVAAEFVEMEEEEDDGDQSSCEVEEREEEDVDLGVDQLNKKCEDFIKKMKKLIQGA